MPSADHRLHRGGAPGRAQGRRRSRLGRGRGRHRRHHQRGHRGRPGRPSAGCAGEYDLWLHVDGAYGGAGLFAPSVRDRYAGIENADSFVVDPHKWLFAPYDCAALLYRDPALARSVHRQDASYLDVIHERPTEWNPTDYAYHLTRRARGLPLWFSLAVHGVRAYSSAIEAAIALAGQAAAQIRPPTPGADPRAGPVRGAVPAHGWGPDDYTPGPSSCWPTRWPSCRRPLGGRDGGPVRVPAPAHAAGPGPAGIRPDGRLGPGASSGPQAPADGSRGGSVP